MSDAATLDILIRIREEIAGLRTTTAELQKAKAASEGFGASLKTGFGIDLARRGLEFLKTSLIDNAREALRMADAIKDGAANLQVSREAYQVLGNVIRDAGGEMQLMQAAIANNNRSLVEARDASSGAAAAYRRLGLDALALEQLPVEQRFERIARAIDGATDKNQAFSDAGKILVTRNLPTLLGALRDLAKDGYDNLRDSMASAGRVMNDETIMRLERAQKAIEKVKQAATIKTGEAIAGWDALLDSGKKDFGGTASALYGDTFRAIFGGGAEAFRSGALNKVFSRTLPQEPEPATNPENAHLREQSEFIAARIKKEYALNALLLERQTQEAQVDVPEKIARAMKEESLGREIKLRSEILALEKQIDPAETESADAKDARIKKLEEQLKQARFQKEGSEWEGLNSPWYKGTHKGFTSLRERQSQENGDGIGFGAGAQAGAESWVSNLGTQAEQVAGLMQSTLGNVVSGIGEGIVDWVTGVSSAGEAMRKLGLQIFSSVVNAIVQMGVQWLVTQALIKTGMITTHTVGEGLRAQRMAATTAEGATNTAALAPGAMAAGISSFGTAAIIGAAAVLAAMALVGKFDVGGYTSDGPRDKPAGIVHAGEWVAPKWMVDHPVYGAQIAEMEGARGGGGPGYSLGGFVKNYFKWGGLPKWMWLKHVRNDLEKNNWVDGTNLYGKKIPNAWVTDSAAAADSARAAMGSLGSSESGAVSPDSSGNGTSAGASLAAAAAAATGTRSGFDSDSFADRITVINVTSEREATAIARNSRARGDIVRIVREDLLGG